MADDDMDLDAMLDSALDEGFADSAADAQEGGDEGGEIDLDAMLDEAMVASVLDGDGDATAEKSRFAVIPCHLRSSCLHFQVEQAAGKSEHSAQSRVLPPGTPSVGSVGSAQARPKFRVHAHLLMILGVCVW